MISFLKNKTTIAKISFVINHFNLHLHSVRRHYKAYSGFSFHCQVFFYIKKSFFEIPQSKTTPSKQEERASKQGHREDKGGRTRREFSGIYRRKKRKILAHHHHHHHTRWHFACFSVFFIVFSISDIPMGFVMHGLESTNLPRPFFLASFHRTYLMVFSFFAFSFLYTHFRILFSVSGKGKEGGNTLLSPGFEYSEN